MLYLQIWNSFWKELAEVVENGDSAPDEPTPAAIAPETTLPEALSPTEKYAYLTEYGTQILCLLHAEKGCIYLSRNFETITGQKCEPRRGNKFFGVIHGDFRDRLKELLETPVPGKEPRPFRCKLQHSDKKYYWYLLLIHPKHNGALGEYVCVMENIHHTMLAQNTLQKARLEAELALRARSEFLANMSHELRTPLNAVIGFSQIIESEMFGKIDNPQYIEYVKHIQESGHDLLAKIEDLLEIANIDAGRVSLNRDEVHAADIIKHVLGTQLHHANSAHVTLETQPAPTELLLFVDRLKLQHILGHLVGNAIKFSPEGGKITLRAETTDEGLLQFSVHDRGTGMQGAKLQAITTALQEDNCWTTNENRSIGLGLALTREFAALHGGNVTVTSQPGVGTTVCVTLPKECVRQATPKVADYLRQAAN